MSKKNIITTVKAAKIVIPRRVLIAGGTVAGLIVAGTVAALVGAKPADLIEVAEAVVVE